ncbi:MAG: helix-turn-helix transcriptional regulator [Clostridiales Family XIII bacterium]|jgi:DNA-binding CsgD family transcriptional regulator/MFS family permease|nr:helix-turn-helix transcriptional regulator [Clostridiales Family XIII bacterium]
MTPENGGRGMAGVLAAILKLRARVWGRRDELSLKNIRKSHMAYMLLFPLGLMLSDVLYHDWECSIGGIDSILLQMLVYGTAWLICALLPKDSIPWALRAAACGGAALVGPAVLFAHDGETGLIFVAAFQFCIGIAAGCGFYAFGYILQNAERWLAVVIIGVYYGLAWGLYEVEAVVDFTITVLPPVLMAILLAVVFLTKVSAFREAAGAPRKPKQAPLSETGAENAEGGSGTASYYFVLVLFMVYYFINITNYYLEAEQDYIDDTFYGIGMLAGVFAVVLVQLVFNRSVCHLWNLYLILTVIGLIVMIFGVARDPAGGSFIYGVADNIGYLAVLYLLGGVAKLHGGYRFFRWVCFLMFAHDVLVSSVLDKAFDATSHPSNYFAITIILVSVGICVVIGPLLEKKIFAMPWMDSLHDIDVKKYSAEIQTVAAADQAQHLNLTAREREVFALLLTDASPRDVSLTLKISYRTVNFHTTNLYRKLNIQSRTELFAKYS